MNRQSTEDIFYKETVLYDIAIAGTGRCTFDKTTPRVKPTINYGLWLILMCQCTFIDYNKWTTEVQNISHTRNWMVGRGYTGTLVSSQFFCKPKTAIKK